MSITKNRELVNYIAEIRDKGVKSEQIAETIREVFPKHTRSLIYKCMYSDLYGIELRKEAVEALQEKYGGRKKDRHKLTRVLKCRVSDDLYDAYKTYAESFHCDVQGLFVRRITDVLKTNFPQPKEAAALQERYCERHGLPMFVPRNGLCFNCHQPAIDSFYDASTRHITSCPHCRRSFCD